MDTKQKPQKRPGARFALVAGALALVAAGGLAWALTRKDEPKPPPRVVRAQINYCTHVAHSTNPTPVQQKEDWDWEQVRFVDIYPDVTGEADCRRVGGVSDHFKTPLSGDVCQDKGWVCRVKQPDE